LPGVRHTLQSTARYFGKRKIFGVLRDPYERLVAIFRGGDTMYGAGYTEFLRTCDVSSAVKAMLRTYLDGQEFAYDCALLPQAEYFEGPYGISLPVDNRQFPMSMNAIFQEYDYGNIQIHTPDIIHVRGCPEVWAGDLDWDAREMVKQVYKRDFELLCEHFGYCDRDENTCIWQVPEMCPARILAPGYPGYPGYPFLR